MEKNLETYLSAALKRLEKAAADLMKTQGYTRETETAKVLAELLKEQVQDENPGSAARATG